MIKQKFSLTVISKHDLAVKTEIYFFEISDPDYPEIERRFAKILKHFCETQAKRYGKKYVGIKTRNLRN